MNEAQDLANILQNQPDGSVETLNLSHVLDTLPYPERFNVVDGLVKKLRYGGTIEIEGVDIDDVNRAMYQGYLELDEANGLLYNSRRSASSLDNIVEILLSYGLNVIHKRCNNYMYYVKAKRNEPNAE